MLIRLIPSQVIQAGGSDELSKSLSNLTFKEVEFTKLKRSISQKEE